MVFIIYFHYDFVGYYLTLPVTACRIGEENMYPLQISNHTHGNLEKTLCLVTWGSSC